MSRHQENYVVWEKKICRFMSVQIIQLLAKCELKLAYFGLYKCSSGHYNSPIVNHTFKVAVYRSRDVLMCVVRCSVCNVFFRLRHRNLNASVYCSVLNNRPLLIIIRGGDIQPIETQYLAEQYPCSISKLIKKGIKDTKPNCAFY